MSSVHPGFVYLVGAALVAVSPAWARRPLLLIVPVLALGAAVTVPEGVGGALSLAGYELHLLRVDVWSRLFGLVFAVIGLLGTVYGLHARARGPHVAAFAYAGCALGAVFSGDLLSLFVWWELMAVASFFLIVGRRTEAALAAGYRDLLVHAFGGALLLAGIIAHVLAGGELGFGALSASAGALLILAGFAVNAAVPPLHAWLPDAYPEAPVTGAVFLSALTTKTAVYALARGFAGDELLVWAGAIMALYGVVFAMLQNDIRRLLSYHIVSQVGYMVCGIGIGTPLALSGAAAHAVCHILYKGLLFMGTGAVVQMTGRSRLTDLGGLARRMPWTLAFYAVGAFSISGVPLFNGFVSKSLVVAAAEREHLAIVEWLLSIAAIGTFLSVGLKLPWFTFLGEGRGAPAAEPPGNMRVAMAAAAGLCILLGVAPGLLYGLLPHPVDYAPYTWGHVLTSVQVLAGTAIGFFWLLDKLRADRTVTIDTDWFYRRGGTLLMASCRAGGTAAAAAAAVVARAGASLFERALGEEPPTALVGRTGPWVAASLLLLTALVVLLA